MQIDLPRRIRKLKEDQAAGIIHERPTIIGTILNSDLSDEDKATARVTYEAVAVIGAGTETMSWALTVMTYHLLSNPAMLERLTEELRQAVDDPGRLPPWTALERLPYLTGVLQESLRLSFGVPGRTARVPTEEDLTYVGVWDGRPVRYAIPRGYAVGMSTVVSHHDERLFPDSDEFRPERWLDPEARRELERGMLAFGKGSRACLGMK